jgi:hypothetical protein
VIKILLLTPDLRQKLKSPLGLLLRGSFEETIRKFQKLIDEEKPSRIISVGDVVSDNLIKHHILPQILVVDNKVMRKPITPILMDVDQTLHVKNSPGSLTDEALSVMEEAMRQTQRTRIVVDGEEDLLTLVAILYAPEDSLVIYGQPHEGVVVVKVTKKKKESIQRIVEAMEKVTIKSKLEPYQNK